MRAVVCVCVLVLCCVRVSDNIQIQARQPRIGRHWLSGECRHVRKIIDDSSTSFFVNSRTLMGCTKTPLEGGSAHPISVLSESAASHLCYLMLTCTHSNDATHSSRYPSLAVLAGLPPPAEGCAGCIEGHSAAPLLDNPYQEWKKASFSQYGRCSLDNVTGYYTRCSGEDRDQIQVMGYSARTADYRYTEWFAWNGTSDNSVS